MITEKYFICLADIKTMDFVCSENSCSIELSYFNNQPISWSSKPKGLGRMELYKKAYQTITDGIKKGERFVEINLSEGYEK